MKEIAFRPATIEDIDEIYGVETASFMVPWSRQAFLGELTDNTCAKYIVGELAEKIIGYAGMWIIYDEAHVTNIAIHPDHRGRKYGERMVRCLMQLARDYGAAKMTLEVRASNVIAQSLYRKLGFEARGRRRGYYSDNHEDAVIMWRDKL